MESNFLVFALLVLGLAPLAWSKDAIESAVTPPSSPTPIMQQNGHPYSSGTFAVGTIQLFVEITPLEATDEQKILPKVPSQDAVPQNRLSDLRRAVAYRAWKEREVTRATF
jgi:hypothetical protein